MRKLIPLAAMVIFALVTFTSGSSPPASAGSLPPGGTDEFEVNGQVTIELPDYGTEKVLLTGNMTMVRGDPDPVTNTIDVEIVALQLTGTTGLLSPGPAPRVPVKVALNPNAPASTGQIDASSGFPADSFFDIQFPNVSIGLFRGFADEQPLHMTSQITGIPPLGDKFDSGSQPHPLHDNLKPSIIVGTMNNFNIDIKPPHAAMPMPTPEPTATNTPGPTDIPKRSPTAGGQATVAPPDTGAVRGDRDSSNTGLIAGVAAVAAGTLALGSVASYARRRLTR